MKRTKNKKSNDLLLEIGTEPLPANSVYPLIKQLKSNTENILSGNHIVFDKLQTFDTCRRLTVLVKGLRDRQTPPSQEVRGPAKEIAFDQNNKPTRAFYGFLKKTGLKEIETEIKKTEQGEYIFGLKIEEGKEVKTILPKVLKDIISSLKGDKSMHWGTGFEFIRPVRWILALFGERAVNFEITGIKSGGFTFGHRVLSSNKRIKILKTSDYFKELNKHFVILDYHKRREKIEKDLKKQAGQIGAQLIPDEELLDELANLTEYPIVLAGSFNRKHLSLPDEVIETSLKGGQKLFALKDRRQKVKNNFLGVIDNKPASHLKKKISSTYESILNAKLDDSSFFLKQDTKIPLEDRTRLLKDLIFQKDLGSVYDKVQRVRDLSSFIAENFNLSSQEKERIDRCAELSKADLTTRMVQEFPALQGLIGKKYALISGEEKEVAEGIYEHYKPKSSDDQTPKTTAGQIISLADKLDTLCACFSIGLIPTGSHDPYSLRRNALGLVRIILEKKLSLSVDRLIEKNLKEIEKKVSSLKRDKTKKDLKEFLKQRLRQILNQSGLREDIIEAVISSGYDDFMDVVDRTEQLMKISKSKNFFEAYKVVERTNNILKASPAELPRVKPKLLKEALEKKLFQLYSDNSAEIVKLMKNKKYSQATEKYAQYFHETLHLFFDKIMVNVDNKKIRNNRLALMKLINSLYTEKVADLSLINF
jgi:glycyl-tRNA synthetase beta chain